MNYWWVNQGDSYKEEAKSEHLTAPDSDYFHHKSLKELKVGDFVLHYAKGSIQAVSNVAVPYVLEP
jgi:hypothetical protein